MRPPNKEELDRLLARSRKLGHKPTSWGRNAETLWTRCKKCGEVGVAQFRQNGSLKGFGSPALLVACGGEYVQMSGGVKAAKVEV